MVTDEFKQVVSRIMKMARISHRATYFVNEDGCMFAKDIPIRVVFNPKTGWYWISCPGDGVTITLSFTDVEKSSGHIYQYLMFAGYISSCVW